MAQFSCDSSALFKYYLVVPGTSWVRSTIDQRMSIRLPATTAAAYRSGR